MNNGLIVNENTGFSMVEKSEDNFVAQISNVKSVSFCSLKATTDKEKVTLFNAMNNPEKSIKECINMEIKAKDVFVEVVQCINEETGESKDCPRVVIIDENGVGYTAVSIGVFSSLKKIFQVFGVPTWHKPVILVPKIISKGTKQITTLTVKA